VEEASEGDVTARDGHSIILGDSDPHSAPGPRSQVAWWGRLVTVFARFK
jgi:hypothetical protein